MTQSAIKKSMKSAVIHINRKRNTGLWVGETVKPYNNNNNISSAANTNTCNVKTSMQKSPQESVMRVWDRYTEKGDIKIV